MYRKVWRFKSSPAHKLELFDKAVFYDKIANGTSCYLTTTHLRLSRGGRLLLTWIIVIIGLLVGIVIATPAIKGIFLPRFLLWLGDFDDWKNPVRKLPPEGEMYILAKGSPQGPFAGILESVPDHEYGKDHVFRHVGMGNKMTRGGYLSQHGIAYVGFNRYIITRPVRYDKWEKLDGSEKWGLVPKERKGPSMYFQYLMATRAEKIDTKGNFPVSAVVTFTVQIISPLRALFYAGGWEVQVNAVVQGHLRWYVGTKSIDQLRLEKQNGSSACVDMLMDPKGEINNLLEKSGVRIISATFIDYDLEAGDAETNKAVRSTEIAELEGNALVIAAKKKEEAAEHVANALSKEYGARVAAGKEHAGVFRWAEAIEEAKPQYIGGNAAIAIQK